MTKINKTSGSDSSNQIPQKSVTNATTYKSYKPTKVFPILSGVALLSVSLCTGVFATVQKQHQVSELSSQVEKQNKQIAKLAKDNKSLNSTLEKQQQDYTHALQETNYKLVKTKQEAEKQKKKIKQVTKTYKKKYNTLKQEHSKTKKQLDSTKKQNTVLKQKVAQINAKRAITLASNPNAHAQRNPNSSNAITVTATAYTAHCGSCSGVTAIGVNVRHSTPNLIAVDPRVVPLGKHVELIANGRSLGTYLAGDTGGAIKGNKIDILVATEHEANSWGVRTVQLRVLD